MSENMNENINENINENTNQEPKETVLEETENSVNDENSGELVEAHNIAETEVIESDPKENEKSEDEETENEESDSEIKDESENEESGSEIKDESENEKAEDNETAPSDENETSDSTEKPAKPRKAKPEEPLIELTDEEKKKIFANTEAILFALGNSVQISKLCEVFELNERSLMPILEEMQQKYDDEERGIEMIFLEGSVQLGTKKETYECLTKIAKIPAKYTLTDTVLETLSIIAYKQPVTRAEIEKIRGVSCDHAISKLIEFDLIEDVGRLEAPGHPLLFGTTEQFLRSFGVKSIGDLPAISPELVEDFKHQAENEAYGKTEGDEGDDTDALIGDGDVNPEDEPPTIVEV